MAETKRDGRTNPDAQARRGNETGCVDKSCGRLFDIVKRGRVRSVPRATFAFARGRSHISGSCALRHRRPSASDVQGAGGLERNRFGRNHRFAPGIFWSHGLIESLQIFEIMLRPGRRRWPTRRAMKKDGRRVTRRRDRAHPTVSRLVTLAYGQGGRRSKKRKHPCSTTDRCLTSNC